jgi:hypothetical protein
MPVESYYTRKKANDLSGVTLNLVPEFKQIVDTLHHYSLAPTFDKSLL